MNIQDDTTYARLATEFNTLNAREYREPDGLTGQEEAERADILKEMAEMEQGFGDALDEALASPVTAGVENAHGLYGADELAAFKLAIQCYDQEVDRRAVAYFSDPDNFPVTAPFRPAGLPWVNR